MPRHKKKPEYSSIKVDQALLDSVKLRYQHYLDLNKLDKDSYAMVECLAEEFHTSPMKMRKLMITACIYETETSHLVQQLFSDGKSIQEIQLITGLKKSSINGLLPYSKVIYKNTESSVGADRTRLYRNRWDICRRLQAECEQLSHFFCFSNNLDCGENIDCEAADMLLWEAVEQFQGFAFTTIQGLKFSYVLKGNELFINRKQNSKSLTKSSVILAFHTALQLQALDGYVKGPKKLGTFWASYLYPMFIRFGIIKDSK